MLQLSAASRLRAVAQAALTFVVVAGGVVTAAQGAKPSPTAGLTQMSLDAPAPAGQLVRAVLSDAATKFPKSAAGWTSLTKTMQWTHRYGYGGKGALLLRTAGGFGLASSPAFAVQAGDRVLATAFVRTTSGSGSALASLRFFTADGHVLGEGDQTGQATGVASKSWTAPLPVAGIAPPGAALARVSIANNAPGTSLAVDDVQALRVTGSAAPIVGPLNTRGREIVDAYGRRVTLRGIEVDGLQGKVVLDMKTMQHEIDVAHAWGANMIRLPINADRWLNGCGMADYVLRVKQLVAHANSYGMYVELDLHTFNPTACQTPRIPMMVDERGVRFWKSVGLLFGANPLVGFDLYNEPHNLTQDMWLSGGRVVDENQPIDTVGMQALYDAVRSVYARNLVFVAGVTWGEVPAVHPIANATNLVYAAHVYTCPAGLPNKARGIVCNLTGPGGITDPSARMNQFAPWVRRGPIIADEFGFPSKKEGRFHANVVSYAEKHGWSGWIAFAFDGGTKGMFDLVRDVGPVNDPAISGMGVLAGLARN